SPIDILFVRSSQAKQYQPLIRPVGTGITLPIPEPEEVVIAPGTYTYLNQHFRWDIEGRHGVLQGRVYTLFPPFDTPDLGLDEVGGGFSIWRFYR
ncbi:MAG: hypothetical protein FWF50_00530, partial [Defluviitaleaceae bacterium]|nr:hypothetical protein [Defluviitaleaceae bacterium]